MNIKAFTFEIFEERFYLKSFKLVITEAKIVNAEVE